MQGAMERGGMPIGPRGPAGLMPGRGRGTGPPAEWNGRVGSAEQRGGFMQRAPSAGTAAPKTPADRCCSLSALHIFCVVATAGVFLSSARLPFRS